ncbi:toxin-antitoxin system HicB family antitoxin [Nocardioides sp. CER19]|uniref:toxin-antitoxin system HicB family antitoxin n=1 Tax=Nocardioides sp. CER19 TaxID=3038538 RepID=UPI002447F356|nr:toxin-antitoxin system HicB family antitoxin [Nocardioides sp. CER19]MDH2412627.1 toxin-antitoxin system HicB family antitoxin [Nocardioides sp. CER19]
MDVMRFVDRVRQELAVAAAAGGPEAVAMADRLSAPLASAFQLALLEALSAAADEITRDLAPGSVEVRLRGGEPSFAVTLPTAEAVAPRMAPSAAQAEEDEASFDGDAATARINFRVPEPLKARIEEAAAGQGRSVNAWLTRAASAALRTPHHPSADVDPPSTGGRSKQQRYTGWVS